MKLSKFTVVMAVLLMAILAIGAVSAESIGDSDDLAKDVSAVDTISEDTVSADDAVKNNLGSAVLTDGEDTPTDTPVDTPTDPISEENVYNITDDTYSTYFNEDGTIQEVKPTMRGVGPVKASHKVHIDRYSFIDGARIEYLDTTDYFKRWKTVFGNAGDDVAFNEVDFGKKAPKNMIMRVKAAGDAVLEMTAGDVFMEVPVAACDDWTEVTFPMPAKVKGVQDIIVSLQDNADVEVDWITFK
jgi:hypothetical protein